MQSFLSNRIRTLLLVHKNIYQMKNWVDIAPDYAEKLESDSLPAGLSLSRMARLEQAKNIVEIGCGSGLLSRHWLRNLPDGVKYTSIDVSEAMIKIAERRKTEYKNLLNNNIQHEFVVGDIHDLSLIPDQTIDAYLGPLVYCHVADPSKALKEAIRVLKKGGRIGVSMGLPGSTSTFMTLLQNCKAKLHEEPKNGNQQQHHHHQRAIKGKDHLIQLVQEAGFEVEFCWEQEIIYDVLDENDASQLVKFPGGVNNTYNNLSEDLKPKFIENLKTEFTELKKTNTPLFNKCLLLTAIKR